MFSFIVEADDFGKDVMYGLPTEIYCDIAETMREECAVMSLLEIWKFDEKIIKKLKPSQIINDINNVKKRWVFVKKEDFTTFIGLYLTRLWILLAFIAC